MIIVNTNTIIAIYSFSPFGGLSYYELVKP